MTIIANGDSSRFVSVKGVSYSSIEYVRNSLTFEDNIGLVTATIRAYGGYDRYLVSTTRLFIESL